MLAVAIGSLVGSVALRPNSPLTATVIATFIIVGSALVVDLAYAYGIIPPGLVHVKPVLLYANGTAPQSSAGMLDNKHRSSSGTL